MKADLYKKKALGFRIRPVFLVPPLPIPDGESKPKPELNPAELAAYTLIANMILNLDETITRN